MKSNRMATSWKRRWFILDSKQKLLRYFDRQGSRKQKGIIELENAKLLMNQHPKAATQFSFQVLANQRTTHLCADTSEEMQKWYSAIVVSINEPQPTSPPPVQPVSSDVSDSSPHTQFSKPNSRRATIVGLPRNNTPPNLVPTETRTATLTCTEMFAGGSVLSVSIPEAELGTVSVRQLKERICASSK